MDTIKTKEHTEKFNELVSLWIMNRPQYYKEVDALENGGIIDVAIYSFLASAAVLAQEKNMTLSAYWKMILMQYAMVESGLVTWDD